MFLGGTFMLTSHWRKVLLSTCLCTALAVLGTGLVRVAAKSATDAPAGFDTPSFNGAHSVSNGIVEPPGDTYARDQRDIRTEPFRANGTWSCLQRYGLRQLPSEPRTVEERVSSLSFRVGHNESTRQLRQSDNLHQQWEEHDHWPVYRQRSCDRPGDPGAYTCYRKHPSFARSA